jgi:hypothetical protein
MAAPSNRKFAAARRHAHRRIEQSARNSGDNGGAGAGSASQRLAGTALEHAQRIEWRPVICMKPAFTRCGKRGCASICGPCTATGAQSTSATTCTACGLPMETAVISTFAAIEFERLHHRPNR